MIRVEEYYKQKELSGRINKKRIYLATDEPQLFVEAKHKYVKSGYKPFWAHIVNMAMYKTT